MFIVPCMSLHMQLREFVALNTFIGIWAIKPIVQIGPLSFQAAIEHKPRQEVRWGGLHVPVVTEWWPACLHKQFLSVHHRGN